MPRGHLVVLEGGEGAGKTTLADAIRRRFNQRVERVHVTREPGGTRPGESIRAILHERVELWAEVFLFLAARNQLIHQVILPAMNSGKLVLSDRFTASTLAYQGGGRHLDYDQLESLCEIAAEGVKPSLTIYLDIDPIVGLSRKLGEVDPVITGSESVAFHARVRHVYKSLAQDPTWVTLDATLPPERVLELALTHIESFVPGVGGIQSEFPLDASR
ncbi:MAG: dTMP kinase [Dehalococcoidia bacterium]